MYADIISMLIHGIDDEFMSIVIYDISIHAGEIIMATACET